MNVQPIGDAIDELLSCDPVVAVTAFLRFREGEENAANLRTLADRVHDVAYGQFLGSLCFGVQTVECRASALRDLLKLPFLAEGFFLMPAKDPPEQERIYPEELYPFEDSIHQCTSSRLLSETNLVSTVFPKTLLGQLFRSIRVLSTRPDGIEEVKKWVTLSETLAHNGTGGDNGCRFRQPSAAELAKRLLTQAKQDLGASGYALFVSDPFCADVYRNVAHEGILYPEMLCGFSAFTHTNYVFPAGDVREMFCRSRADAFAKIPFGKWMQDDTAAENRIDPRCESLFQSEGKEGFGPYFVREGLSAAACLQGYHEDRRCLIVFMNFRNSTSICQAEELHLRRLRDNLAHLYPRFVGDYFQPADFSLVARWLETANRLADLVPDDTGANLQKVLKDLLEEGMKSLGVDPNEGLATIHGFKSDSWLLHLAASAGAILSREAIRHQNALKGEGILSWVALHRRPIRVDNLRDERIRGMVNKFHERSVSELAVPMLAGDSLVGVLNFESFLENAFTQSQLEQLSVAANQIALAWRGYSRRCLYADLRKMYDILKLFRSVQPVTNLDISPEARSLYKRWLDSMTDSFRADDGDVWFHDKSKWKRIVASPRIPEGELPRPNGWTEYVFDTRQIVCITGIKSNSNYKCAYWHEGEPGFWSEDSDAVKNRPSTIHPVLTQSNLLCEIGIPLGRNNPFGVIWLKYNRTLEAGDAAEFHSALIRDALMLFDFSDGKHSPVPEKDRFDALAEAASFFQLPSSLT